MPEHEPSNAIFLSCLYGSEHMAETYDPTVFFLSCLYGSEPVGIYIMCDNNFLSCLYGSELLDTTFNLLIIKEHDDKKQKNPFY